MFGGLNQSNELYTLSTTDIGDWSALLRKVTTTGDPPSPRTNHAAVVLGPLLIIWGGEQPQKPQTTDKEVTWPAVVDTDLRILNLSKRTACSHSASLMNVACVIGSNTCLVYNRDDRSCPDRQTQSRHDQSWDDDLLVRWTGRFCREFIRVSIYG